jgi:hypothetical protein
MAEGRKDRQIADESGGRGHSFASRGARSEILAAK